MNENLGQANSPEYDLDSDHTALDREEGTLSATGVMGDVGNYAHVNHTALHPTRPRFERVQAVVAVAGHVREDAAGAR